MGRTGDLTPEQYAKLKESRALVEQYLKTGGRMVKGPFSQFNYKARRRLNKLDRLHRRLAKRQDIGHAERTRRAEQLTKHIEQTREDMTGGKIETKPVNIVQRGMIALKSLFNRKGGDR